MIIDVLLFRLLSLNNNSLLPLNHSSLSKSNNKSSLPRPNHKLQLQQWELFCRTSKEITNLSSFQDLA
jgi:hypothetical protein